MGWTHKSTGLVQTNLPAAWSGRNQIETVAYVQGATSGYDLNQFKPAVASFDSGDVMGTRGDQTPDWTGDLHKPHTALTDIRYRFYVIPEEIRLVNPAINTALEFILWNTWPEVQTVVASTSSDLAVIDPDLDVADVVQANEYFTTSFVILDGSADINGTMTFTFTDEIVIVPVIGSLSSTFNIVPDVPVKETWEFLTDVIQSHNGNEQRIALRNKPRVTLDFRVDILDFEQRREQYITAFRNMGFAATIPMYQHATKVTQDAAAGATKVFFDPTMTQMREGEQIVIIDPMDDSFQIGIIGTMDADGANTTGTFSDPIAKRMFVFPASPMLLADGSGITTYKITGKMNIKASNIQSQDIIRTDNVQSLTTLDGHPIMEKRLMAGTLTESFNRRREVMDNETGLSTVQLYGDLHPNVAGVKKWQINRYDGTSEDYMRLFIDTVRGGQKAWLLPTFMPDMILNSEPADGGGELNVVGSDYIDFFSSHESWQYVMLQYGSEAPTYHQTSNINVQPDGSTTLTITPGLALGVNDDITMISFLNRVRGADRIMRTHQEQTTEYSWAVTTMDQAS